MTHPGGRPRKFETPEEIESLAAAYFAKCEQNEKPYTVTGLAEALGTFRDVLIDYEDGKYDEINPEFSNAIKRAKAKVEQYAEERVYDKTAGAAFMLTNLSRRSANPWKQANSTEITGKDGGALEIALTDRLKEARERAQNGRNPQ